MCRGLPGSTHHVTGITTAPADADAAAMAECRAWVASLQAFVMEVDMQVPTLGSEPLQSAGF